MHGNTFDNIEEEKDQGIIVQRDLKVSAQCAKEVSTANRFLIMIKRTFKYRSKDTILNLYKTLVRPHLEYCVQARRPFLKNILI
jgi:ribonuclease P/MRP protein subunit RPP40